MFTLIELVAQGAERVSSPDGGGGVSSFPELLVLLLTESLCASARGEMGSPLSTAV